MNPIPAAKIRPTIIAALKEDCADNDITTKHFIRDRNVTAVIFAKDKGVLCGLGLARLVFKTVDRTISFELLFCDGESVKRGDRVACIRGKSSSILKSERTALNFLSHLSGIATLTRQFVRQAGPHNIRILDTRKTLPNLRGLEKYAVRIGGGVNHRMDLADFYLIKDNHLQLIDFNALRKDMEKVRRYDPKRKIEIEVKTIQEFIETIKLRPDIIMLDNMPPALIKQALAIREKARARTRIELSGGINLKNIRAYLLPGVNRIALGALTHSAPALDFSLEITGKSKK